jgi:hypothetical protein
MVGRRGEALFYLPVYAFMNLGAFGVVMLLAHKEDDGYDIGNFRLLLPAAGRLHVHASRARARFGRRLHPPLRADGGEAALRAPGLAGDAHLSSVPP